MGDLRSKWNRFVQSAAAPASAQQHERTFFWFHHPSKQHALRRVVSHHRTQVIPVTWVLRPKWICWLYIRHSFCVYIKASLCIPLRSCAFTQAQKRPWIIAAAIIVRTIWCWTKIGLRTTLTLRQRTNTMVSIGPESAYCGVQCASTCANHSIVATVCARETLCRPICRGSNKRPRCRKYICI